MSPKPTIFISAVSKELRSARQLVANTLTFLGYEPVTKIQENPKKVYTVIPNDTQFVCVSGHLHRRHEVEGAEMRDGARQLSA